MKLSLKPARILDFDTESRPLSWIGPDFTTSELTAIAASFGLDEPVQVWLLGRTDPVYMLQMFRRMWDEADIVTGHYIRNHDLPRINAMMAEFGLPALDAKLTIDTKNDLVKIQGVSKSQQNLSEMLGIEAPKVGMSQNAWRAANRLERVDLTRARVIGDVRQHQALRLKLNELGWLNPPQLWEP